MREKNILEEMRNIALNQPLWPGNTISHATANECIRRGWATRDNDGNIVAVDGAPWTVVSAPRSEG